MDIEIIDFFCKKVIDNPDYISILNKEVFDNAYFMSNIIKENIKCAKYMSETLKDDKNFINDIILHSFEHSEILNFISKELKRNKLFFLNLINNVDPFYIKYASKKIKHDIPTIIDFIKTKESVFYYLDIEIKYSEEIIELIKNSNIDEGINIIVKEAKKDRDRILSCIKEGLLKMNSYIIEIFKEDNLTINEISKINLDLVNKTINDYISFEYLV